MAAIALLASAILLVAMQRYVASHTLPPFRPAIVFPASPAEHPALVVKCCSEMEEITFLHLRGEATNLTDEPLKNVVAHASFRDRDGREVASAQALLFSRVLKSEETARFQITTPVNLAITQVAVDFRFPGGPAIPARLAAPDSPDN